MENVVVVVDGGRDFIKEKVYIRKLSVIVVKWFVLVMPD